MGRQGGIDFLPARPVLLVKPCKRNSYLQVVHTHISKHSRSLGRLGVYGRLDGEPCNWESNMAKVPIDVVDGSDFTDAEWAEIDRLAEVLEISGEASFNRELEALAESDPRGYLIVMSVFFPEMTSEAVSISMAELGMESEEASALVRKLESAGRKKH